MSSALLDADLPESVSLEHGKGGLPVLRVATAQATADVYLHGAHVTSWTPAGEEPVLWMSDHSAFAPATAIRGGIPICFPWFGAGLEPDLAPPAHGFARLALWRLAAVVEDEDAVTLTLRLTGNGVRDLEAAEKWPRRFEATYVVTVGRELGLTLTVRNTGEEGFTFEEALHTYLAVTDVRAAAVRGLDGAPYLDKVPGARPGLVTQEGDVTFTAETDRVYASTTTASITDGSNGRVITATKEGSAQTVVWNPWVDKSAAMVDFGDDEWTSMACLETANVLDGAITLDPGGSHRMSVTYAVSHE